METGRGQGNTSNSEDVLRRHAVTELGNPEGPVLLFGHGYGTDQSTWKDVAAHFTETHRVVLFDYVGSGKSDLSAYDAHRYDSLHGYAQDLLEVIDAIGATGVTFVGHSVSGMIGGLASAERPEVFRRLIMLGASPRYVNDGEYLGGFTREDVLGLIGAIEANQPSWAANLAPAVTARPDRPEITERVRSSFIQSPNAIASHFARVVFFSDMRALLPKIPVPCTLMQSQGDIICPPHIGQYLADRIQQSTLIELKSAGHFVHLCEPDLIAAHVKAAL